MNNLSNILNDLTHVEGINTAVVVGRDGFIIDSAGNGSIDTEAVGAVISTGIGSSEVMGRELGVGLMTQGMVEYQNGIIMTSLLGTDAVLAVVADLKANLGNVRYQVKKRAPEVQRAL